MRFYLYFIKYDKSNFISMDIPKVGLKLINSCNLKETS